MAGSWIEERLLAEMGRRIVDITERTRQKVIVAVERGIADGLGAAELGKVVEDIAGFRPYRAEVIARTETNRVLNLSQLESFRSAGINQVMAIDGDEDAECAARNGQTYSLEEALSIEDHPNGTLDWVPMAMGVDPKTNPTGGMPPPQRNQPVIPRRTLKRGPFTSKPKPEPKTKRSKQADPIENIKTAEDLSTYLAVAHETPVSFYGTQKRLWKGKEYKEVAEAFHGVSERLGNKFPKGTVSSVEFQTNIKRDRAADMHPLTNEMRVFPLLRTNAKRSAWGAAKQFDDVKQVRKTITHEIGHAVHNKNVELLREYRDVYAKSVKFTDIDALERQLAVYRQRGEAARRNGRTDYYENSRRQLEHEIEQAKAKALETGNPETYVSGYGQTGGFREDFADAFYAYVWHPEKLRERWPARYTLFEKYLGKGD